MSGQYADIFQASATGNLTKEEAVKYSESYFKELDNQSSLRFAAKKNRAEGKQKSASKASASCFHSIFQQWKLLRNTEFRWKKCLE